MRKQANELIPYGQFTGYALNPTDFQYLIDKCYNPNASSIIQNIIEKRLAEIKGPEDNDTI